MLVTEEESKKIVCKRETYIDTDTYGNNFPVVYEHFCIGFKCMSWRWFDEPYEYVIMDNRVVDEEMTAMKGCQWLKAEGNPPIPTGRGWKPTSEPCQMSHYAKGCLEQKWRRPRKIRHGYCGLAGKPND